ncbi:MAG: DNA gyrase subunit A [Hydrogenophaga sp.]|jgi:DNA gyrase subunit A|uniref:DNA gyrase subunit A n=1 Tax=Hydrogenophaga sp. TaxID=1904254 RepID=UPI00271FEB80|nr:DNA gyrase subunit A [Hydrogenophaga sp.]MDO9571587.1 DNA gyrase subunit A [Hydrogenophaga sp.]MDP2221099.1 DNA gyrase subunit A [Hydrogenophaga sp.]MDP3343693.1 DNA gyrase subunit A [Hydrogenophaga sp.]MDP3807098.1 DNA gyrase subunit A [Hydrogenophaga sp.]MDP3925206.1 DNA gyrase subunit A [Hydrogenophaga sp.]
MTQFAKETLPISLEEEMRRSYLDYAMSVIVGRALPDARDGLKPVHRRVLFAMHELNNDWNRPYKKSARIVGDVIGKYHPHGDSAVYDTIVRMAQDFSLRHMLVDGQGNFGSVDGDNAAAMRYTEIRLSKIAHEMLADIDKETVNFGPNYDGSEKEPLVLPSRLPNLLVNGSSGIAVGMATNIPPHNLNEVVDACLHMLKNPEATIDDLMEIIPAPDFPTAGIIYGINGVKDGYRTGRGRVVMRAKCHFEDIDKGQRQSIIVDELPYQVNKKTLQERIAELVHEKKIEGISHIQDESDKSGMRLVIELKRGEVPEVVLNNLYKQTQLQDTFGINMVALIDGQPRLCNLRELIQVFLEHRREVVTRRTVFNLRKARERGHVLEGLAVALANIDEFIKIIRESPTPPVAKAELMTRSWDSQLVREMLTRTRQDGGVINADDYRPDGLEKEFGMGGDGLYRLSETQAQEILQMRLQRLTGLEQDKIVAEYKEVMGVIDDLLDILAKPERVSTIIGDELTEVKMEFGQTKLGARRSEIEHSAQDLSTEDLITPTDMVVTLSHSGYIKSQPLSEYRSQKRGGRGKQATATKEDDWIDQLFIANTHDYILCFSNRGRLYWLKVWEVPAGSRGSRGRPIVNMFPLQEGEKINVVLPLTGAARSFPEDRFVFMATSMGTVKKTALNEFSNPRKAGIIAVDLDEGDYLIGAALTDGQHDVMLFSDGGKAVRFDENDVRPMGRNARGVRGMLIEESQNVIAMLVAERDEASEGVAHEAARLSVLTATINGYGKRTPIAEYTRHGRGTKGMIAIQQSERNGKVVAATLVHTDDEIMLITDKGVLVRTRVSEIREMGRATQGVTLISMDEGAELSGLQRIVENDANATIDSIDVADDIEGNEPKGTPSV